MTFRCDLYHRVDHVTKGVRVAIQYNGTVRPVTVGTESDLVALIDRSQDENDDDDDVKAAAECPEADQGGWKAGAEPLASCVKRLVSDHDLVVVPLQHLYPVAPMLTVLPRDCPLKGGDAELCELVKALPDAEVTVGVIEREVSSYVTRDSAERHVH